MAKVSIATVDGAAQVPSPQGAGEIISRALFSGAGDPIHLAVHQFGPHASAAFGSEPTDVALFVWNGSIGAGGTALSEKSSAVVERSASLEVTAGADGATVLAFKLNASDGARRGGHVHL